MRSRVIDKMRGKEKRRCVGDKVKICIFFFISSACLIMHECTRYSGSDLISMKDSALEELLSITPGSTLKVDTLNEMAYRASWNGGEKPLRYAESAKRLAKQIDYQEGLVISICTLGQIHFLRGDFDRAKQTYEDGLKLATQINYRTGKAMAYAGLGRYYQARGKYAGGLENFSRSEDLCKTSSDPLDKRVLAAVTYGLGALYYYDTEDYRESKRYFERYFALGREIGDAVIITSGYYTMGVMKQHMKEYTEAKKLFWHCFKLSERINIIYNMANAREGLGDVYLLENKYEEALKNYENSHKLFLTLGNKFQIMEIKKRLGEFYNKRGELIKSEEDFKKAIEYLSVAITLATEGEVQKTIEGACKEIVKSYTQLGDFKSALIYYKKLLNAKEFLRKNEMSRLKYDHEFKKKTENEAIKRKALVIGVISLFVVLLVAIRILIRLRKQKRELEESYKNVERMSEIGQAITSSLSVREIIDQVYENVNRLMDAAGFYIGIYNDKDRRLELPGGKEYGKEMPYHYNELSEINSLSVYCFNNEMEIRIGDYSEEYRKFISEMTTPKVGHSFKSHIFIPLVIRDKCGGKKKIGVIIVQSDQINAYSEYHYNILKNLAIYTAIALDNANAYKQIEEQKEKIELQTRRLEEQKVTLEVALKKEKEISDHKDDLMHTVSHQYKTPLSNIHSSAQVLRDYYLILSESEQIEYFKKIFLNIEQMTHLIDQLLKFGKNFNPNYYDLNSICANVIDEFRTNEGSRYNIELKAVGECIKVRLDKDFLKIMLHNLLENSIKYSPRDQKISVEIICEEEVVVIKVIDNGIGIPDDYLKMPFERFHRGSNVDSFPGTGLGLSIVKRYTEMHGGSLAIESELLVGTIVTIKIPKNIS